MTGAWIVGRRYRRLVVTGSADQRITGKSTPPEAASRALSDDLMAPNRGGDSRVRRDCRARNRVTIL